MVPMTKTTGAPRQTRDDIVPVAYACVCMALGLSGFGAAIYLCLRGLIG